jgi:hypothetical protein
MPNHITNILILEGPWELIKKIISSKRDKPVKIPRKKYKPYSKFKFESIAPIDKTLQTHCNMDMLDLQIETWGTKWNPYDVYIKKMPDKVYLKFNTAWEPPRKWLEKLSNVMPEIIWNLSWVDEDFPDCGYIFSNPIKNSEPVQISFSNKNDAIEFIKEKFPEIYFERIDYFNQYTFEKNLNNIIQQLDKNIEIKPFKYIILRNTDKVVKYIIQHKKNEPIQQELLEDIYKIVENIFNEFNIKITFESNIIIIN